MSRAHEPHPNAAARRKLLRDRRPEVGVRQAAFPDVSWFWRSRLRGSGLATVAMCAAVGALAVGCSGASKSAGSHGAGSSGDVRVSIAPASGSVDKTPNSGITVSVAGGTIRSVSVRTKGDAVAGALN